MSATAQGHVGSPSAKTPVLYIPQIRVAKVKRDQYGVCCLGLSGQQGTASERT